MRRVHKKRLRVRNEVREAKAKLQRLEKQLKRLKDEKKKLDIEEVKHHKLFKRERVAKHFSFSHSL